MLANLHPPAIVLTAPLASMLQPSCHQCPDNKSVHSTVDQCGHKEVQDDYLFVTSFTMKRRVAEEVAANCQSREWVTTR